MKNRTDEKNRLWNEVLGKKRAYEKDDEQSDIELTMDGSTYRGVAGNDKNILKDANSALDELMGILNRQQADLQKMSEDIQKSEPVSKDMMKDLDSLQESLKQDYDVTEEVDVKDIDLWKQSRCSIRKSSVRIWLFPHCPQQSVVHSLWDLMKTKLPMSF